MGYALAGAFLTGGAFAKGYGFFSDTSGLSYLLGFTVNDDSLTFVNFYGFRSEMYLDIAESPSLPLKIPSTVRADNLTSPSGSSDYFIKTGTNSHDTLCNTSI